MMEFNNGFVTAIALFLEHKNFNEMLPKDKESKVICDLRLYGATDHLYDIEIPTTLSEKLKNKIIGWRDRCFHYRLEHFKDTKITDKLFTEAEDILKRIDEEVFKTKKVVMNYR